jgi:hypothetical protein
MHQRLLFAGFGSDRLDTEAMAAGNVVFGGLIGLGVDAATGAMNNMPIKSRSP